MVPRSIEVAAVTGGIALLAALAGTIDAVAFRAIPALAGAALVTGIMFHRRSGGGKVAVASSVVLALAAAFALDAFFLFVLAHGYPELREFRRTPWYQALMVLLFGALASLDARALRLASSAESARS
jgi:hypothetical protein